MATLFNQRIQELTEIANINGLSLSELIVRQCAYIADIEETLGDGLSTVGEEIKKYFGLEVV